MKYIIYYSILIFSFLMVSCSKDTDDVTSTPMSNCDVEEMGFQSDILPIFNTSCNGCHGADSNLGGITLDNHTDTKSVVDAGRLLGAIQRASGFSPMPQGGDKLSDCNIDKVSSWVADGALNN